MNKLKNKERIKKCRYCDGKKFTSMIENENYKTLVAISDTEYEWVSHATEIGKCDKCEIIMQTIDPDAMLLDKIYSKNYLSYPSVTVREESSERNLEFFNFIKENIKLSEKNLNVLEIGSYDGAFLKLFKDIKATVQGCDPNKDAARYAKEKFGINTKIEFFSKNTFTDKKFNLIIGRLVMEHVCNLNSFLNSLDKITEQKGFIVVEVPDVSKEIKNGTFFQHTEHTIYFTKDSIKKVFNEHGYKIIIHPDIPSFNWIIAQKMDKNIENKQITRTDYAELYKNRFKKNIDRFNQKIKEVKKNGGKIGVYGVGYYFMNLFNFTDLKNNIDYIYDGNPKKHGMKIPEINLYIRNPSCIKEDAVDAIVIASGSVNDIILRIRNYNNNLNTIIFGEDKYR